MKKIFLSLAFIAGVISLNAQRAKDFTWFDFGLKVQTGASGLYNSAIADSDRFAYRVGLTDHLSYGAKFGINYGTNGLAIDVMTASAKGRFRDKANNNSEITVNYSSLDVYALYRNAANLGYFELGPKASFVSKATYNPATGEPVDIKSSTNSTNFAGVLGFGVNVLGTDGRFSGILGLRFEYGFTDFVNQDVGAANGAPLIGSSIYSSGYKSSAPVFAGIVFELNWGIGGFGKAQCGGRSKFIMF